MSTSKIFDLNRHKLAEIERYWNSMGRLCEGDTSFLIGMAKAYLAPEHHEIDHTLAFLNSLLVIDRHAVQELIAGRVPCNEALANHPTVQVAAGGPAGTTFVPPQQYRVGLLGILNGLLGTNETGWGWITAQYDSTGALVRFARTSGEEKRYS